MTAFSALQDDQLLRTRDVCDLLAVSRTTVYELIKIKALPQPIRIGPRAVRHSSRAILEYRARGYQAGTK